MLKKISVAFADDLLMLGCQNGFSKLIKLHQTGMISQPLPYLTLIIIRKQLEAYANGCHRQKMNCRL